MSYDLNTLKEFPDFPLQAPYFKEGEIWTSQYNWDFEDKSVRPDFVTIHDVTLRDGDQTPGVVLLEDERVRIGDALNELKVPRIEAGMAMVGKRVENAMRRMVDKKYQNSTVYGFCRAHPKDIELAIDIGVKGVIIEYTVNPYLIKYAYKKTHWEVADMIVSATNKAKAAGLDACFMGWDWFRTDLDFTTWLLDQITSRSALDGLTIVDTYGCATPDAVKGMFSLFHERYPNLRLEFHGHNDIGCGNANCLAAVEGGASVIHTAVHGLGERCGNVATEEMAVILEKHKGINTGMDLTKLYPVGEVVSTISKVPIHENKPVLGRRPYMAEAGITMDIAYKLSHNEGDRAELERQHKIFHNSFICVDAWAIGRPDDVEFVLGKSSGKNSIRLFLDKFGLTATDDQVVEILDMVHDEAIVTKGLVSTTSFLQFAHKVIDKK